jgi:hypothetical protein
MFSSLGRGFLVFSLALAIDKRSSLFGFFVSDKEKKVVNIEQQVTKLNSAEETKRNVSQNSAIDIENGTAHLF